MSPTRRWLTTIVVIAIFVVGIYLAVSGMADFRGAREALMSPGP